MTELPNKTKGIIETLGLESLSDEDKAQLTSGVVQLLSDRIILRVLQTLTKEEKEELGKLTETGDDKQIAQYVANAIPGLDAIAYSEYQNISEEMLTEKDEINEAIDEYERHQKRLADQAK